MRCDLYFFSGLIITFNDVGHCLGSSTMARRFRALSRHLSQAQVAAGKAFETPKTENFALPRNLNTGFAARSQGWLKHLANQEGSLCGRA